MGEGCAKPLVGCVVVVLALMVLTTLLPLLVALAIATASVLLVPAILFGVWRAPWSLRTKRAITGSLLYPVGAYFLCRYTRLSPQVKAGAVAVAAGVTLLIAAFHVFVPVVLLVLGVTFLTLFLGAGASATYDVAAATERPAPIRGTEHIPDGDLRRLLEIEEAQTGSERRLLLAREFSRVAEGTLAAAPTSLEAWPDPRKVATLRAEARFLLASATDTWASALPESPVDDAVSPTDLTVALRALDGYLRRLEAIPRSEANLETLRVLTRDRGQIQGAYDRVVQALTAPTRSTVSSLPTVPSPAVKPLPGSSRSKS